MKNDKFIYINPEKKKVIESLKRKMLRVKEGYKKAKKILKRHRKNDLDEDAFALS